MYDTSSQSSFEALATNTGLEASDLHAAFASERRRVTLRALVGTSTPVDGAAVARTVAARETDTTIDSVPEDVVERVHLTLYHIHLPKLAELGLVEYDADDDVIEDYEDSLATVTP